MKLAILGGGPGGYTAAVRAAQLGMETVLIEKDKNLGGTCLNRGCIPTKALVEAAARFRDTEHASEFGIDIPEGKIEVCVSRMQERKNGVVRRLAMGVDGLMKKNGVTVIHELGRLLDGRHVQIGGDVSEFDAVILATGSSVAVPPVFPVDGVNVLTSDHILNIDHIPESMIVAGSGAVGMEFASIFAAFGSKVSIVEMAPRLMPLEDGEVSAEMQRLCRKSGISVFAGCAADRVEATDSGVKVFGAGLPEEGLEAEILLAAVGRRPNLDCVDAGAGLKLTARGRVEVDAFMRTNIPGVYAVGDIVPSPQLAHMAAAEGILAVEHLAGLEPKPLNAAFCPSATYSFPEVGSVGLTQEKAEEQGLKISIGKFPMAALGKAAAAGTTDGFVKLIADAESGKLLGAHMIGAHACDLISEAALALQAGADIATVAHTIHPHPSFSEAVSEAAHHALGCPINFVPAPSRRGRR